jgi:hypothetical protein
MLHIPGDVLRAFVTPATGVVQPSIGEPAGPVDAGVPGPGSSRGGWAGGGAIGRQDSPSL